MTFDIIYCVFHVYFRTVLMLEGIVIGYEILFQGIMSFMSPFDS